MSICPLNYANKHLAVVTLVVTLTACGGGGGGGSSSSSGGGTTITAPPPGSGAVLTSLSVTPDNKVLKVGTSQQMTAIGTYDDGGQLDLTDSVVWTAGGTGDITLGSNGLVTAIAPGSDIVSVTNLDPAVYGLTYVYTSTYGVEGTAASPVALTLDSPHAGEVNYGGPGTGNGYSYYAVNVTPGASYYVFLTGLDADAHLELYDDSGFSNRVCASENYATTDELCYAEGPAGGILYIAVNGDPTSSDVDQGAAFTLTVRSGYHDEGDPTSPVAVTLDTPVSAQVGHSVYDSGPSGYLMNGRSIYGATVAVTGRYTVSLTSPTDDVSLTVLDGPGSGTLLCESKNAGTTAESCSFQAETTNAYVHVNDNNTTVGAGFTLTVFEDHVAYTTEGTDVSPMNLTTLPHHGHVGGTSGYTNSYYSIPVTAMQSVKVQATGVDGNLGMYVYDGDSTFTTSACSDFTLSAADLVCMLEPSTTGTVYVKMVSNGGIGTEFFLDVTPIHYPAQGTSASPQVLVSAPTYNATYAGTVDSTSSYYQVPVNAGKLYRVGLANVSGNVSLSVYDDAGLSSSLCTSNNSGLADESCQTTPTGSNVWIVVGGDTYGSKFDLTVDRVYVQQGTQASPMDITSSLPTYTGGEAGSGTSSNSYFMATLTAGKAYNFQITNNTDATLSTWVYDNSGFNYPTVCQVEDYNSFSCTVNPLYTTTAYIRVTSDDPYGSAFDLSITEVPFSTQGTDTSPVDIGSFPVAETVGTSPLQYTGGEVNATNSYYVADISGGYAYVNFAVGLVNQSADVDLYVYDDASFSNLLCSSIGTGTGDETCTGLSPAGSNLYIKVSGASSGFGGTFDLTVDHDYSTEGAVSTGNGGSLTINSIALTQGVTYQGQSQGTTPSYYYLPSSLISSGSYTVTVSNIFDSACVWVYDEADGKFASTAVWSDFNMAITSDKSVTNTFNNGVFIKIGGCDSMATGTAYSVTVN